MHIIITRIRGEILVLKIVLKVSFLLQSFFFFVELDYTDIVV